MAKLVAKTRAKFGSTGKVVRLGGGGGLAELETTAGKYVEPGETFEVDEDRAKELIEAGAAVPESEFKREQFDGMSYEEKLRTLAEEARLHGVDVGAIFGGASDKSTAIDVAAHQTKQADETALIEKAQADEKKRGKRGSDKDDKDDKKSSAGDKK